MAYQTIDVQPIAGALGADIHGADLSRNLSNQTFDEIHQAFLDHLALFFRNQTLTPAQQVDFARRFGPIGIYPFLDGLPDAPEVIEVLKTESDEFNFGGGWHSDTAYLERPSLGSVLYAHEIPDIGGDTLFANMYMAYEALSEGMRAMLDDMIGVNSGAVSAGGGRARRMQQRGGMATRNLDKADSFVAEHPVVRKHPETGRKSLYVNSIHTVRFKDMTEAESRPLLEFLNAHAVRPEFTCRFRWTPGALAIWDNRCTQHNALNDYPGKRRRMHRVTVEGERPVA
ncbi:MAG: TauD/TfdA family dioxygenase [Alphaproteobacteria bacterium]|nr:TauD/TfdA family dioxygenase [Alphaproteobacteria bacterium]